MHTMRLLSVLVLVVTMSAFSCKRPDDNIGGKGGKAVLKVTPQHHSKNIDSCTIYIKYNAETPPSETTVGYDESVVCVMENGVPIATITGLKKGKYYIYGFGWDPGVSQNVKGGIPYTITEENTVSINVPVTED